MQRVILLEMDPRTPESFCYHISQKLQQLEYLHIYPQRTEQAACSTIWEMTVLLSGGVMDKGEQNTKSGHKACEEKGAEDEGRLEPTLTSSCVPTPCKPD